MYNSHDTDYPTWLIVVIIGIVIFATFRGCQLNYGDERVYKHYTVTDKGIKNYDDSSTYLIYTVDTDGEVMVFCIEDRLLYGRYNSSDDYAKIEIGKTYDFQTIGIRNQFWSSYPDIIGMEEVK